MAWMDRTLFDLSLDISINSSLLLVLICQKTSVTASHYIELTWLIFLVFIMLSQDLVGNIWPSRCNKNNCVRVKG